jgi:hypothetical protein
VEEVKFNGEKVTPMNGEYTVRMADKNSEIEVVYGKPTYGISVINDNSKGMVKAQRPLSSTYAEGAKISFSIAPIGDNVVEEVKFNGETIEAVDGLYTITIAAIDNVIEVIYKAPVVEEDSSSSEEIVDSSSESVAESSTNASCFSGIESMGMMIGALVCSALAVLRKKEDNE